MNSIRTIAAFALVFSVQVAVADSLILEPSLSVSPEEAMEKLKAGNDRFATSRITEGKPVADRRAATATSQHPFAIIVACADSRSAPELVFDQSIGDLFVVRTAGNLVDDYALGSIEYAVEHVGSRLVVVLGHERCGAVTAALASPTASGHVNALVRDIQPAIHAALGTEGDSLDASIKENARLVAAKIQRQAEFGDHKHDVRVVAAVYDLDTGVVAWLDEER